MATGRSRRKGGEYSRLDAEQVEEMDELRNRFAQGKHLDDIREKQDLLKTQMLTNLAAGLDRGEKIQQIADLAREEEKDAAGLVEDTPDLKRKFRSKNHMLIALIIAVVIYGVFISFFLCMVIFSIILLIFENSKDLGAIYS